MYADPDDNKSYILELITYACDYKEFRNAKLKNIKEGLIDS